MPPKRAVSAKVKGTVDGRKNGWSCNAPNTPPKTETFDEETKEFFLIQIRDLENQVARYQKKCDELEVKAGQTRMTYDQMIADRDEIIHYLEGLKRQKTGELARLKTSYEQLQHSSVAERFDLQDKIYKLRNELQDSKDRMAAEQIVLGAKLTALDQFRQERELNEMEREELIERLQEVEHKHADYVYDAEKKHFIAMDKLKRDMIARLAQLAKDYSKEVDEKMMKQAKRMVRENVTATTQLAMLSDQTTHLLRDNEHAQRTSSQLRLRVSVMESLEHQWAKKLRSNARIVELLSTKCGQQMALVDTYKMQVEHEKSKCSKQNVVVEQLQALRKEAGELKSERGMLHDVIANGKQQLQQLRVDNTSLRQLISDSCLVLNNALQPRAREDCVESSVDIVQKRDSVLQQLLALLNTDNLPGPPAVALARDQDEATEETAMSTELPRRQQQVLRPTTDLSQVRTYQIGDVGLVPRASERLCTSVDTVRWLSASLNYQMVGRVFTRSVSTQTPDSWT